MLDVEIDADYDGAIKKILDFASRSDAEIQVGFLAGRKHVATLHKDDTDRPNQKRKGNYTGIHGGPPDLEDKDTAELARELSLGTATIPARPFIPDGLESESERIETALEQQIDKAKEGLTPNWDKVGSMAVGAIQKFVRGDYYKTNVPNSRRTVEWKGSDTPLIDGGDLIGALTYVVNGKEAGGEGN